ncbi:MAG: late competence development ComFB family protein [Syntrophomonadaceae bacterium]|nr:late competence development ComFB family protein [Syntrophomonadaceae bacterium]
MKAINVVEKLVWEKMDDVLQHKPEMCKCDKCRADVAAYTLNKLHPRYVSSPQGELYARAEYLGKDFSTALIVVLTEAIEIVCKNPKHDKEK